MDALDTPDGWKNWGMREWYVLTYIAGALFIAGQIYEYAKLTRST